MKNRFTRLFFVALTAMLPMLASAQGNSVTLPYSMDFEGLTSGGNSFVPGWTRVDSCLSGSAVYPNVYSYGGTHGNVLNFMGNGMSTSGTMRAATPRIPAPLNQLELSLTVYKSGLSLYAASDPADLSTYHLVATYNPGYVWTSYELRTDTVAGIPSDTGYLVFTCPFGSGYSNGNPYLDDLTVAALNPCARTGEVTVVGTDPTSAVLSWPAVAGAQGYTVLYDTVDTPDNALQEEVSSTTVTLTDLEPGREYTVWVHTNCGDGVLSDARVTTFTTQLSCYAIVNLHMVGISNDGASFQWDYDSRGNAADGVVTLLHDLTDTTVADYEEPANGATFHFFVGLDRTHEYLASFRTLCGNDTAEGVTALIAFPDCGQTPLAQGAYDKSLYCPLTANYRYGYSQMLYPAADFYGLDTIRGLALHRADDNPTLYRTFSLWMGATATDALTSPVGVGGMTHVAGGSHLLPAQEWDTVMFDTPFVYDGLSNIIVTFCDSTGNNMGLSSCPSWWYHESEVPTYYNYSDNNAFNPASLAGGYTMSALPDMRFIGHCSNDYSCEVAIVAVTAVGSETADIEWLSSSGTEWVVEYRTQGGGAWTVADTLSGVTYSLVGLTPSTHYEVRVGTLCEQQTRYSTPVTFTTECALIHLPYHFTQSDMVAAATEGFTSCWAWSQYFYKGRLTESHRGYVRNAGNGEWFMLPAVAEALQGVRLRTWVASSDAGYFKVGIASASDCSDVEWIDTVAVPAGNPNLSHDEYICYLDGYTGNGNRVVVSPIVNNNFHYIYFFDFHLEYIEDCRPALQLTLDSADAESLTLHWTPVGPATQWAVYVDGTEVGTADGTPSFTVTGLAAYTNYEISVRTLCGEGDTSDAVNGIFRTGCSGESCLFTVSGESSTGDGWNGGFLTIMAGDTTVGSLQMRNGSSISETFTACADMVLTFNWHSGNADQVCSLAIVDATGNTVFASNAEGLGMDFYSTDSICGGTGGENPDPGPNPGLGPDTTGIEELSVRSSEFGIFPNPASTTVTVTVGTQRVASAVDITILDLQGRNVSQFTIGSTGSPTSVHNSQFTTHTITLDVSTLPRGTYFVRIVTEQGAFQQKLLVR